MQVYYTNFGGGVQFGEGASSDPGTNKQYVVVANTLTQAVAVGKSRYKADTGLNEEPHSVHSNPNEIVAVCTPEVERNMVNTADVAAGLEEDAVES